MGRPRRLKSAAIQTLQRDQTAEQFPPTMRIAAASSADTPLAVEIGRAAMGILEVLPGEVRVRRQYLARKQKRRNCARVECEA